MPSNNQRRNNPPIPPIEEAAAASQAPRQRQALGNRTNSDHAQRQESRSRSTSPYDESQRIDANSFGEEDPHLRGATALMRNLARNPGLFFKSTDMGGRREGAYAVVKKYPIALKCISSFHYTEAQKTRFFSAVELLELENEISTANILMVAHAINNFGKEEANGKRLEKIEAKLQQILDDQSTISREDVKKYRGAINAQVETHIYSSETFTFLGEDVVPEISEKLIEGHKMGNRTEEMVLTDDYKEIVKEVLKHKKSILKAKIMDSIDENDPISPDQVMQYSWKSGSRLVIAEKKNVIAKICVLRTAGRSMLDCGGNTNWFWSAAQEWGTQMLNSDDVRKSRDEKIKQDEELSNSKNGNDEDQSSPVTQGQSSASRKRQTPTRSTSEDQDENTPSKRRSLSTTTTTTTARNRRS